MGTDQKEALFDLGRWIGRTQGFAAVAGRCSMAQAQALKHIRETGAYKALGIGWDEFCRSELGINRVTAERIIRRLDELGEAYFRLAEIMRISPAVFRQLPLEGEALEFEGERIPISRDNAPRLVEAVRKLRAAPAPACTPPADAAEDEAAPVRERILVLRARLRGLMEEANALSHRKLKPNQRKLLAEVLLSAARKLARMAPPPPAEKTGSPEKSA